MIVSINQNNSDKYLNLFKEAYELLGLNNNEEGRFTSLAEYYGHMADLFATAEYKYVLLPLDEEAFYIDLNSRTINVPQSFSKCASVQNDQLAETIIFEVDRYFDFMDLSMTDIHVQWTIPENKKDNVALYEGATLVEMIDLSEAGKIRFAWPLNDSITKAAGPVNFSVRFSLVDSATPDKIYYSLNTTSATINVKPALQKTLDRAKVESPNALFQKAILNSVYTGEGIVPPVMPEFIEPGSNIMTLEGTENVDGVKVVSLNDDNTITLYAQAVVADAGAISYKWYHKAADGKFYDCADFPLVFNADGSVKQRGVFGTVNENAFLKCNPQPTERTTNERYYYVDTAAPFGYELYTGNDFNPAKVKNSEGQIVEVDLYERYTSYTVPNYVYIICMSKPTEANADKTYYYIDTDNEYVPYTGSFPAPEALDLYEKSEVVTGWYQAAAKNTIISSRPQGNITTPNARFSDMCLIPGPSDINFKKDGNLEEGLILKENKAEMSVSLETDPYEPTVKYEWRQSVVSDEDEGIKVNDGIRVNEADIEYIATTPGWYKVKVISTLNREEKNITSNVCRVTNFPLPPIVANRTDYTGNINDDDPPVFSISASISNANKINEKLLSDGFEYKWQIRWADTDNFVDIDDTWKGVSGLNTNSLKVNSDFQFIKGVSSASLRCLVINTLNNEKAVFDHSAYLDNENKLVSMGAIDPSLGKFEASTLHVMANKEDQIRFTLTK